MNGLRRLPGLSIAVWVAAVLLVASIWSVERYAAGEDYASTEREFLRGATNLTRSFEEQTARTIDLVATMLRAIVREYEHGSSVDLAYFQSLYPELLHRIARFDARGDLVAASRPTLESDAVVNVADRDYFQGLTTAGTDEIYLGRIVRGRTVGGDSMPIGIRIVDPEGRFKGVLTAGVDAHYFTRFYSALDLGRTGGVYLVGVDGFLRAQGSTGKMVHGADLRSSPLYTRALQRTSGVLRGTSPLDGTEKLYVYQQLKGHPLMVVVSAQLDEVFADARARTRHRIGAAALASALVMLLAWILARKSAHLAADRDEAKASSRLKSEFVARVSHEMRTPLHGILGFSEYLSRRLTDPVERESAALIQKSGRHLLGVVNVILDLARMEAGRLQFELEDADLHAIATDVASTYALVARDKGLAFETRIEDSVAGRWRCDATRVTSMLNNLLGNAVKFTERGSVRFTSFVDQEGLLVFSVTDTGPGIPEALREAIFEPFRQGDTFVTRRHGGSGLGLALVKETAQCMGGSISLESRDGHGSRFTLRLPFERTGRGVDPEVPLERAA